MLRSTKSVRPQSAEYSAASLYSLKANEYSYAVGDLLCHTLIHLFLSNPDFIA